VYNMFHTRNILHRMAYQHKTSNAVELMYICICVVVSVCSMFLCLYYMYTKCVCILERLTAIHL